MVNVYVIYCNKFNTWNVMLSPYFGGELLVFGTADYIDQWLEDNKSEYEERKWLL